MHRSKHDTPHESTPTARPYTRATRACIRARWCSWRRPFTRAHALSLTSLMRAASPITARCVASGRGARPRETTRVLHGLGLTILHAKIRRLTCTSTMSMTCTVAHARHMYDCIINRATSGDLETCRRRDDVLDFVLVCSMGLTSLFRPRRGAARSVSAVYSVVNLFNLVVKKKLKRCSSCVNPP